MQFKIVGVKELIDEDKWKWASHIYCSADNEEEALKAAEKMLPGRVQYWVESVWEDSHNEDHDKMQLLQLKMQKRLLDAVEKGSLK